MKRTVSNQLNPAMRRKIEEKLDQALKDSFPASDPVSLIQPGLLVGHRAKVPRYARADGVDGPHPASVCHTGSV
jgi:hypothetical protein